MRHNELMIVKGHEALALLNGREAEIMEAVRAAYEAHSLGQSSLPHSTFLTFPTAPRNRIIALPAYLGDGFGIAGVKWIASFPGNHDLGLDRASAVVILNSAQTGLPEAIMEGSVISAKRTAASAALAAKTLHRSSGRLRVGMIGCGLINFEIARFLAATGMKIESFILMDTSRDRSEQFGEKLQGLLHAGEKIEVVEDVNSLMQQSEIISLATTAATPHLSDISQCASGTTILHISLRDLSAEVILSADNVVDDVDHVTRAQTSVHLAQQLSGHTDFIRCTLADVLTGRAPARRDDSTPVVFSPFGLGVLDLAVGKLVHELARNEGGGTVVDSFLPPPWAERP